MYFKCVSEMLRERKKEREREMGEHEMCSMCVWDR